ncbi:DoxX family protein [Burkholderia sp. Ac-20345]|uniref:DoxX family protein n=1 Tax=Burkholderia sp. Ac-20345 TaxID=2703891 RepID=UPI00197C67AC|nr:DoxX family protein [Burkholderia sp. Ac-20345]MBN3777848.1 DoxX family protein [Burkholderia sp. Ac-20345]
MIRSINRALYRTAAQTPAVNAVLSVLVRILIAGVYVGAGISKIFNYAGTGQYMAHMGVPSALLPLVIFVEVAGGLALIAGFMTRIAALGLAIFSVIAAVIFHSGGDQTQQTFFMMNLSMTGGLLALVLNGAGRASFDRGDRSSLPD